MSSVKQHCLVISGVQEIREAPVVHENIVKAFQDHASITLDVDAITEVDLTLIQVIESARVSAAEQGRALRLSAPASGALLTALKRGGFLGESGDPRTQFWLAA